MSLAVFHAIAALSFQAALPDRGHPRARTYGELLAGARITRVDAIIMARAVSSFDAAVREGIVLQ